MPIPIIVAELFVLLEGGSLAAEGGATAAEIAAGVRLMYAAIVSSRALAAAEALMGFARFGTYSFAREGGMLFLKFSMQTAKGPFVTRLPLVGGMAIADINAFIQRIASAMMGVTGPRGPQFNAVLEAARRLRNYAASGGRGL